MSTTDLSGATWRKSSRSAAQEECVEIADLDNGHRAVRDSKHPTGPALIVPPTAWTAFTTAIQNGEFA